jgi:hypothetical protein
MSKEQSHVVYKFTCDLCGYKQQPCDDYWANNFGGGAVTIAEDGMNGVDTRNWEHLCRSCRKEIQDAVDAVAVKRGGKEWWKRTVGHKSSEQ